MVKKVWVYNQVKFEASLWKGSIQRVHEKEGKIMEMEARIWSHIWKKKIIFDTALLASMSINHHIWLIIIGLFQHVIFMLIEVLS
jgi:hypothetical protein